MKRLALFTAFIFGFYLTLSAQDDVAKQCKKAKYDAQQSRLKAKEFDKKLALTLYKNEFTFLLKAESVCGTYNNNGVKLLLRSYTSIKKLEKDKPTMSKYTDSIIGVFERALTRGIKLDSMSYGLRAQWYIRGSNPNYAKADEQFQIAQKWSKFKPSDYKTSTYYKNLYTLYVKSDPAGKVGFKKRLISEYFRLSRLINEKGLKPKTQVYITKMFNNVVRTCDDILPELGGYLSSLPQNVEVKIASVNNFIDLLDAKKCSRTPEYEILIDTLLRIDRSVNSVLAKSKLLHAKGKNGEAMKMLKEAKSMQITDSVLVKKINDKIASLQLENVRISFNKKNYKKAFSSGKALTGKYRGEGLKIAGKSVAAMANSCGASTFDRKCNYYYAIQVLEKAKSSGASVSDLINKYQALLPTADEKFDKGNPKTWKLSCWGVEVSLY